MKSLDNIAGQVSGLKTGYVVEIQGFASADGGASENLALSEKRADAALRYLVSKNVPMFRISNLGLGTEKPVGDNKTRDGRTQNRRVEVRVMQSSAK
jgi:OOP family OmpA-OmpF porin